MGQFDGTVREIINSIAAARRESQSEASNLAQTAENMFGNVSLMVRELKPALEAQFPDLDPQIEIGSWDKGGGGASNSILLKRKGEARERSIRLQMKIGISDLDINGRPVPQGQALGRIKAEIIRFFTEE